MEEKTVPWWRKVLNLALSGIRSGLGLFTRSHKSEADDEPEIVAGREEDREKTELTEHSSKLELIAEAAHEVEAVAVSEAVTVPEAAIPDAAIAVAPEAHAQPEEATVPEAEPAIEVEAIAESEAVAEFAPGAEGQDEAVAAQATAESAPELRSEADAAMETIAAVEPAVEVAPEEITEEAGTQIESREEIEVVAEVPAETVEAPPAAEEISAAVAEVITEEAEPEPYTAPKPFVETVSPAEFVVAQTAPVASSESVASSDEVSRATTAVMQSTTVMQAAKEFSSASAVYQGTTSEAAQKLKTEGGGGFDRRIKPAKPMGASALEECFKSISPESQPLPATAQAVADAAVASEPEAEVLEAGESEANLEAAPVGEVASEPAIEAVTKAETSIKAEGAIESEAPGETETVAEADAVVETEAEAFAESQQAEELPAAVEPVEEVDAAEDPIAEPATPAEELIELVTEETQEQMAGQPAAKEEESVDAAAPSAEAAVVENTGGEVSDQPMEFTESNPGNTAEPESAGEAAPVSETAAGGDSATDEFAPEAVAGSEPDAEPEPEAVGGPEPEAGPEAASEAVAEPEIPCEMPTENATEPADQSEEQSQTPEEAAEEDTSEEAVEDSAAAIATVAAEGVAACSDPVQTPQAAQEPAPAPQPPAKPFIKLESRDNPADLSPFSVIVSQVYDGPLDLLLDLIRKQDIDVYDIPIARITAQFLAYVNQLKSTDVDVAGEFIYTASLLIHIKSKMLLPRAPSGPDDAAEDPRRELVERLLEHERFKNAAQMLQQKQMLEAATWTNPGIHEFRDDAAAEPEIAADTVDLVRVFRDILDRVRNRPVIDLQEDSVTVGQMIQFLARRLTMEDKPVALHRLLSHSQSERALIAMFLALLELVRLQAILLRQDRAFSEIFIKKHTGFEALMNDGLANATDEWR